VRHLPIRLLLGRADGYLASAGYGYAEQECDEQARERRFAGDGADGRERLAWLPRGHDGAALADRPRTAVRRERSRDRARHIGCGIDGGALGHAGLRVVAEAVRFSRFDTLEAMTPASGGPPIAQRDEGR